jgi:argininosuccinate lyase
MLTALDGLIGTLRFHTDRMAEAAGDWTLRATALAEFLVTKGVPFREAHETVGQLVALCGGDAHPSSLKEEELAALSAHLPEAVRVVLGEGIAGTP